MKTILTIFGTLAVALVVFCGALLGVLNARGGIKPEHAALSSLPVVGSLVRVQDPPAEGQEPPDLSRIGLAAAGGQMAGLEMADPALVVRLAEDLQSQKEQCAIQARELTRRERVLDAREEMLGAQRDELMARFESEREALLELRAELKARKDALDQRDVVFERSEQSNLRLVAEVCAGRTPEATAEDMEQMWASGQREMAAKILSLMPQRTAAKVLDAIGDPKVRSAYMMTWTRIIQQEREGT